MLKRAQQRQARAAKLVEKWQAQKIANLDRAGVAAVQPRLWPEESDTIIPQLRHAPIPNR